MKPLKNNNGFALALILSLIPFFVAGLVFAFSFVNIIQTDLALKYICREGGLQGQQKVSGLLESLLSLNPKARDLKREQIQTEKSLASARALGNPFLIASYSAKLAKIVAQRLQLDIRQKQLIQQSNIHLSRAHSDTKIELRKQSENVTNPLLKFQLASLQGTAPTLAVRPDTPDMAPTYSPERDFENKQALAHEWQYRLSVRAPYSSFLKNEFTLKKTCAVTLRKENSSWVIKIIKGRSSWKSAW